MCLSCKYTKLTWTQPKPGWAFCSWLGSGHKFFHDAPENWTVTEISLCLQSGICTYRHILWSASSVLEDVQWRDWTGLCFRFLRDEDALFICLCVLWWKYPAALPRALLFGFSRLIFPEVGVVICWRWSLVLLLSISPGFSRPQGGGHSRCRFAGEWKAGWKSCSRGRFVLTSLEENVCLSGVSPVETELMFHKCITGNHAPLKHSRLAAFQTHYNMSLRGQFPITELLW